MKTSPVVFFAVFAGCAAIIAIGTHGDLTWRCNTGILLGVFVTLGIFASLDQTNRTESDKGAAARCGECGLLFERKSDLNKHLVNWHASEDQKTGVEKAIATIDAEASRKIAQDKSLRESMKCDCCGCDSPLGMRANVVVYDVGYLTKRLYSANAIWILRWKKFLNQKSLTVWFCRQCIIDSARFDDWGRLAVAIIFAIMPVLILASSDIPKSIYDLRIQLLFLWLISGEAGSAFFIWRVRQHEHLPGMETSKILAKYGANKLLQNPMDEVTKREKKSEWRVESCVVDMIPNNEPQQ